MNPTTTSVTTSYVTSDCHATWLARLDSSGAPSAADMPPNDAPAYIVSVAARRAARANNVALLSELRNKGAASDSYGQFMAAVGARADECVHYLLHCDITLAAANHSAPLAAAVANNDARLARTLLEAGARATDRQCAPLLDAAERNRADLVATLVGAPRAPDEPPLRIAAARSVAVEQHAAAVVAVLDEAASAPHVAPSVWVNDADLTQRLAAFVDRMPPPPPHTGGAPERALCGAGDELLRRLSTFTLDAPRVRVGK